MRLKCGDQLAAHGPVQENPACVASAAEFLLPLLLFMGLLTRLSAFGLLMMTMVIQIFVHPDAWWTAHAYWTAILNVLIARGPGAISLDHLLFRRRSAY